jgi:hypothetical protein
MAFNSEDNRERYCNYLEGLIPKFKTRWVTYCIASIVGVVAYNTVRVRFIRLIVLIATGVVSTAFIYYIVRHFEIASLYSSGFEYKHVDIKVYKLTRNRVNKYYSIEYLNSIGIKLAVGERYRVVYLYNTLRNFIVDVKKIGVDNT